MITNKEIHNTMLILEKFKQRKEIESNLMDILFSKKIPIKQQKARQKFINEAEIMIPRLISEITRLKVELALEKQRRQFEGI